MRRRLPKGVRMYTGDDFNYAELIKGDDQGYSDALLGIFDAIAPAASAALGALAGNDWREFEAILAPTVPLSRHIFKAPTRFYKTGIVFLAYINGLQDHFTMVGGQESARSARASGRAVPAGRPGRPVARSRKGGGALPRRDGGPWHRRLTARGGRPARSASTPRRRAAAGPCCRRSTAARATASPASRPGATNSPRRASPTPPRRSAPTS